MRYKVILEITGIMYLIIKETQQNTSILGGHIRVIGHRGMIMRQVSHQWLNKVRSAARHGQGDLK